VATLPLPHEPAPTAAAPPRVLHVITRFTHGGSEQRLRDVLRAVDGEHHVIVGRDSEERHVDALRERSEVTYLDCLVRAVDPRLDATAMASLITTMRQGRFDVVHTHQAKGGLLGRVAARAAAVPTVFHSASMASFGPGYGVWESRAFALAERLTAPLVDRYFVVGDDLAHRLSANGVAPDRLEVIRSSLDLRDFRPPRPGEQRELRERMGIDPDAAVFCYVGSLEERKGVLFLGPLLEFARRVTGEDVRLVVAGEGPLRRPLHDQITATLGPEVVTVLGHVPYVADVMRAADALVLPSAAEGLPQVLVQAAASHLPFAAYAVDGVEEMCRLGAVGRVVELGQPRALAVSAIGALAHGRAGRDEGVERARLAPWSPDEVARRYGRAYAAVTRRNGARATGASARRGR
jgi:glycosyltransferase involved in cell wall biosynthesis